MGKTRFTDVGGTRIAYELRRGLRFRRRPWVVLIQGLGFDRSGWDPVARGLGHRFRLVLIDNRGIGRSAVPTGPYSVAVMARDVVGVLDAAGIDAAHVIGTSLGGMIAQEVAIGYPDRVRRLVLVCTTPGWPLAYPVPAPTARLLASTGQLPAKVAVRRYVENALSPTALARRPRLPSRLVARQRARPPDRAGWAAQATAGATWSGQGRQARIRAETLVLQGTADAVVDPRSGDVLAARIPQATLVLFPDAGHLLFWEQPRRFVHLVGDFLRGKPVS